MICELVGGSKGFRLMNDSPKPSAATHCFQTCCATREPTPEVRIALEGRIRSLRNEIDSQAADVDEEFKALTIQQMVQVLDEWEARKLSEMDSGRTRSRSPIPRHTKRPLNRVSRQFAKEAAAAVTTSTSGSGGSAMVPEPATPPKSASVPEPATPPSWQAQSESRTPSQYAVVPKPKLSTLTWKQKPPTPPMRPIRQTPSDVSATLTSSAYAASTLMAAPQFTTALPKARPVAGMVSSQAGKGGRSGKGYRKGAADFDAMAGLQRQLPTLMKRFIGGGELWLGPLPMQGNLDAMPRATVQVCCLENHPEQRQGLRLDGAHYVHIPISDGSRRDQAWQEALPVMLSALRESHVVYVHCLAGRHRAAAAVTLILAGLGNLALEDAARTVEDQRSTAQVWKFLQESGEFRFHGAHARLVSLMAALLHRFHIGGQKTTSGNAMVHPSSIGAHLMAQLPLKGSLCCKSFLTRLLFAVFCRV